MTPCPHCGSSDTYAGEGAKRYCVNCDGMYVVPAGAVRLIADGSDD